MRWAWPIACLLAIGTWTGCGGTVSAEQKEAMARISDLGGRVNFKRGGYEIDLTKTPVENEDLVHLKKIPNLKNVDLSGTRISDEGLEHLRSIETLEFVYLQRTRVTREGAASFKQSLPKAEVTH
jgi:Leucine-rich repeat (LRR) protein